MGLDIKELDDTRREKERRINRLGHELKKIDRDVEYKLATYVEHTDELDTLSRIYEESKENLDELIGDKDGVEFLNEMVDALMSAVEYYQAKVTAGWIFVGSSEGTTAQRSEASWHEGGW